eukprot:scaffold79193_cov63-Phaeocystis_antarctica.AAC.3
MSAGRLVELLDSLFLPSSPPLPPPLVVATAAGDTAAFSSAAFSPASATTRTRSASAASAFVPVAIEAAPVVSDGARSCAYCAPKRSSWRRSSCFRCLVRSSSFVVTSFSSRMVHTAVPSSSAMRRRPATASARAVTRRAWSLARCAPPSPWRAPRQTFRQSSPACRVACTLGALAPLLGHLRHGVADHPRDARGAVEERNGVHAHLHHGQQLVHDVRRRRDHDGVAVSAHRQARQLVHEVEVHRLLRHELAEDLLDRAKDLFGIVLDDALTEGLQAIKPGLGLVELLFGRLEVTGELDAAAILLQRHEQLLLLLRAELRRQHLVEDDEGRGRLHLGRLEDAPEQHLCMYKGQTRETACVTSGTNLACVLQLNPVLQPHLDHHVQLDPHLFDLIAHRLQGGIIEGFCIEERVLQYHVHLALRLRLEVVQPLLPARLEQLADQVLQCDLVLSLVLAPGEAKQCHLELPRVPACELAQVGLRDGVVLVGVPQGLAGTEVEEHHAKGPQVVGDICCVHAELLLAHQHAGVGVGCLEKDLGHLGRAVAAAGQLGAEALVEEARDVEIDQRPVEERGEVVVHLRDANDVERLEVGVDAPPLDMQVIEPAREICTHLADERPLVGRDAVVHQRSGERAVGELHHKQVRVFAASIIESGPSGLVGLGAMFLERRRIVSLC